MGSPAAELAQYLEDQGIGVFGGNADWSVHAMREPIAPDNVVTLYDTGGPAAAQVEIDLRIKRFQVRVRGRDYQTCYEKHEQIYRVLVQDDVASPEPRDIGEGVYVGVWLVSDIIALGRDDNGRHILTANYEAHRQPLEEGES